MAGHSKWANIKHRKGAQDAKRAKVFSRAAKLIILAAQNGGADPETNYPLKTAIDSARKVNMPKDNIERAIKAGAGSENDIKIEEVVYEAMGPEGASMIIFCATDNTNRALTDVKTALKKTGGKFVPSGSLSFNYNHVGIITLEPKNVDSAELDAIDAGAADVITEENKLIVITSLTDFHTVQKKLTEKKYEFIHAKISYEPTQKVTLSEAGLSAFEALYDAIDEIDDVQEIYTNVE